MMEELQCPNCQAVLLTLDAACPSCHEPVTSVHSEVKSGQLRSSLSLGPSHTLDSIQVPDKVGQPTSALSEAEPGQDLLSRKPWEVDPDAMFEPISCPESLPDDSDTAVGLSESLFGGSLSKVEEGDLLVTQGLPSEETVESTMLEMEPPLSPVEDEETLRGTSSGILPIPPQDDGDTFQIQLDSDFLPVLHEGVDTIVNWPDGAEKLILNPNEHVGINPEEVESESGDPTTSMNAPDFASIEDPATMSLTSKELFLDREKGEDTFTGLLLELGMKEVGSNERAELAENQKQDVIRTHTLELDGIEEPEDVAQRKPFALRMKSNNASDSSESLRRSQTEIFLEMKRSSSMKRSALLPNVSPPKRPWWVYCLLALALLALGWWGVARFF